MEINKAEITVIEHTVNENSQTEICQLSELQLALIGGGIGDVVWS